MSIAAKNGDIFTQISINQKLSCMSITHDCSYFIVSLKDLRVLSQYKFDSKVLFCEMYENTNLILIVLESEASRLRVWDDARKMEVESLEFSSDIAKVLVRSGHLTVWIMAGELIVTEVQTFQKKARLPLTFAPDIVLNSPLQADNLVAWNESGKGMISVWDFAKSRKEELDLHSRPVRFWTFDPSGRFIASSGKGTVVKIRDLQREVTHEFWLNYNDIEFSGLTFSPSADLLAISEKSGDVKVLSVDPNRPEKSGGLFSLIPEKPLVVAKGLLEAARCFWIASGDLLLISGDNKVRRVQVNSQQKKIHADTPIEHLLDPSHFEFSEEKHQST